MGKVKINLRSLSLIHYGYRLRHSTVEPLYKGHPCSEAKVAFIEGWPLQRGEFGKEYGDTSRDYRPFQRVAFVEGLHSIPKLEIYITNSLW